MYDITQVQEALKTAWSMKSSSEYTKDNPARGQCGVSALVAQDILGGQIYKTEVQGRSHFYNFIHGERHDFSASQFEHPVVYEDVPTNREDVFHDTTKEQYTYLKTAVSTILALFGLRQ